MELCCCCLNSVCYKDMCNEYEYRGVKEIYRDMLQDTFNLIVSQSAMVRQLICEQCIVKLRDASAFKAQVVKAKETLLNSLISIETGQGVKLGHEVRVKVECEETPELEKIDDCIYRRGARKSELATDADELSKLSKSKPNSKHKLELTKNREHTTTLILNSNICLFISLKTKYRCYFCDQAFLAITELRGHSKTHSEKDIEQKFKRFSGQSFINADISNLACKLCSESCNDLDVLGTHLKSKHDVPFRDTNNFFIPYKLESGFHCLLCNEKFYTYSSLSIHMNSHYKNHVCEICGISFINKRRLGAHLNAVHTVKLCTICQTTFRTVSAKVLHMRKYHNYKRSQRYCLECGKTFLYTYMLDRHKIEAHGAKNHMFRCSDCDKSFLTQNGLRIHTRSVHLRERNHACSVCEMRFFTAFDKKRHMKSHDDVRSFSCSFCEGKFKVKGSLDRHLKKQHSPKIDK